MAWHGGRLTIEPLPWYLGYIQAADRAGVPAWKLIDGWSSREFWKQAYLIVADAESRAQHTRREREDAMAHAQAMQR